jgi:hypothetical protein
VRFFEHYCFLEGSGAAKALVSKLNHTFDDVYQKRRFWYKPLVPTEKQILLIEHCFKTRPKIKVPKLLQVSEYWRTAGER